MTNQKTIESEITGEVFIKINSQYNNINANKVIVAENVIVRLFGNIHELLIIKKGAEVHLHGKMKGKIENEGGKLFIY
jgi:hypothetical protein